MNRPQIKRMRRIFAGKRSAKTRLIRVICGLFFLLFCTCRNFSQTNERINLNTASGTELMRLPYVGQTVARRILEHRSKHGPFKRLQDVIVIKGLSAKRYREIAHLIRI